MARKAIAPAKVKKPKYDPGPDGRDPQRGTIVNSSKKPPKTRRTLVLDPNKVLPIYLPAYECYATNPGSTLEAAANAADVAVATLKAWWERPGFQRGLQEMLDRVQGKLAIRVAHRLASRVEQVKELGRLYDDLPDSYVAAILTFEQGLTAEGRVAAQGEAVASYQRRQVPIQRSNASAKANLVKQIHDIVEPHMELHLHLPGAPEEMGPLTPEEESEVEKRMKRRKEMQRLAEATRAEFEVVP